jgi:dephospho-CoA kinase
MGKRESKYIIGLTGNIGTGKSEVRKILQCLGALGIDADLISRQLMEPGGIAFAQVRDHFGNVFITPEGKLDRARLAALVFHDSEKLTELESIIHPLVVNEVEHILNDTKIPVVVIEAIKLIESGLINQCDALWVTDSPEEIRLARLVLFREMSEDDAHARIQAQPSQEEKIKAANIVIQNTATLDDLLLEVKHAWETTIPDTFRRALQEVDCV